MNTAFLVVSVLHPLAVLPGGKQNTKQVEERLVVGLDVSWEGVCGRNSHKMPSTGLSVQ